MTKPRRVPAWVWRIRGWLAAIVGLLVLMLIVLLTPYDRAVQIEAQTEIVSIEIPAGEPIAWDISGFSFASDCTELNAPALEKFAATDRRLVIRGPVNAKLTRAGSKGVLSIELIPQDVDCAAAAAMHLANDAGLAERELHGAIYLAWPLVDDKSAEKPSANLESPARVFRLRGVPSIGEDLYDGVRYLLLSGRVSLIESMRLNWLGWTGYRSSYVADTRDLLAGDRILPASSVESGMTMAGFVRIAEGVPMQVSLQGPLDEVSIVGFSKKPVVLSGTIWTQIRGEALLSYLLLLVSTVFFLFSIYLQAVGDGKQEAKAKAQK